MPVRDFNDKIDKFLGKIKFCWKFYNGKKIESPKFEYPILFGIEMEYEVDTPPNALEARLYRGQVADRLEHTYKHFAFCKHDGSLENGFEIVSVPMSFDAHTEQWKSFFEEAPKNGLSVHVNCAMHVHASRELLTPLQIGKILTIVYNKNNEEFFKVLAERAKMVYLGNKRYGEGIGRAKKISDVNHHVDRYAAVNITGAETIEFRFFKSTLDLDKMLRNLEFCDALIRFSWPSHVSIMDVKEDGLKYFFNFVLENRKTYPRLAEFLRKNKYIEWKIKKVSKQYISAIPVIVRPKIVQKPKKRVVKSRAIRKARKIDDWGF